jgi:vacuolar-type H+-ATPase subunit I/STV1
MTQLTPEVVSIVQWVVGGMAALCAAVIAAMWGVFHMVYEKLLVAKDEKIDLLQKQITSPSDDLARVKIIESMTDASLKDAERRIGELQKQLSAADEQRQREIQPLIQEQEQTKRKLVEAMKELLALSDRYLKIKTEHEATLREKEVADRELFSLRLAVPALGSDRGVKMSDIWAEGMGYGDVLRGDSLIDRLTRTLERRNDERGAAGQDKKASGESGRQDPK